MINGHFISLFLYTSTTFMLLCGSKTNILTSIINKTNTLSFYSQCFTILLTYLIILLTEGMVGNIITTFISKKGIQKFTSFIFIFLSFYSLIQIVVIKSSLHIGSIVKGSNLKKRIKNRKISLIEKISLSYESIDENDEFDYYEEGEEEDKDKGNYIERLKNNFSDNANLVILKANEEVNNNNSATSKDANINTANTQIIKSRYSFALENSDHQYYDMIYILSYLLLISEIFSINTIYFVLYSCMLPNDYFLFISLIIVFLFYLLSLGSNGRFDSMVNIKLRQLILSILLVSCSIFLYNK